MNTFNDITDNVLICIAFSCSKTVTSYGLRCGAAIVLGKDPEKVDEVEIVMEKKARATWSNIPNAAMENFTWVVNENKYGGMCEIIHLHKKESIHIYTQVCRHTPNTCIGNQPKLLSELYCTGRSTWQFLPFFVLV